MESAGPTPAEPTPTVIVLADDLIWSTRLVDSLRAAGATASRIRREEDLVAVLAGARRGGTDEKPPRVVVDLTARAYDGVEAVRLAAEAGARVVAVGQHDDAELRRRAKSAGAEHVYPYRRLFEDGPAVLRAWLGR